MPAPLIYNFWEEIHPVSTDRPPVSYIVMQYIDGDLLSEVWSTMSENTRHNIREQILDIFPRLHSLKSDNPGPVGGGVSEGAFFTLYGAGPFESRAELETWFNERWLVCQDFGIATHTTSFTGRFEHLVMCHRDIHLRNMILDRNSKLWLIDWANAGYYPVYLEIAVILSNHREDMFQCYLNTIPRESWREDVDRLQAIGYALSTGTFMKPRQQYMNQSDQPVAHRLLL